MRFTVAWASVLAQNISLKLATLVLTIATVMLALTTAKLSLKEPFIVERGCITKAAQIGSTQHSQNEIEAFLKEALAMRFNNNSPITPGYLSTAETSVREGEIKELSNRNMIQKVILNSIKIDGDSVTADCDRLVSVGQVRSALPFALSISLATVPRNEANPYGLVINKISPVKKDDAR
jgi:hypothetical protein